MEITKEKTVSLSGLCALDLYAGNQDSNLLNVISTEVSLILLSLYKQGYDTFLSGMDDGFDMIAAEEVLKFKQEQPDVRLIAVIPFRGQEESYSEKDKFLYGQICQYADQCIYLAENNTDSSLFIKRNDFLMANSSRLVCYCDGKKNDTMCSRDPDMPVINIHTLLADYFANTSVAKQVFQRYDYLEGLKFCKEGVTLGSSDGTPIIIAFEHIDKVDAGADKLIITLHNQQRHEVPLFPDDCKVKFPPM